MSLLPSPCRATALSAACRLDTIDLEMECDLDASAINIRSEQTKENHILIKV
jgi:seryl-tRNA(Sec) selenium transferase